MGSLEAIEIRRLLVRHAEPPGRLLRDEQKSKVARGGPEKEGWRPQGQWR